MLSAAVYAPRPQGTFHVRAPHPSGARRSVIVQAPAIAILKPNPWQKRNVLSGVRYLIRADRCSAVSSSDSAVAISSSACVGRATKVSVLSDQLPGTPLVPELVKAFLRAVGDNRVRTCGQPDVACHFVPSSSVATKLFRRASVRRQREREDISADSDETNP